MPGQALQLRMSSTNRSNDYFLPEIKGKQTQHHLISNRRNEEDIPPARDRRWQRRGGRLVDLDAAARVLHRAGAEPARRLRGPGRGAGGHDGRRLDALRRHRLAQVRHLLLHGRRARLGESARSYDFK